ncbi:MAG: N-acetylneuraminic acid mutarotase, partial [Arcticibacterium sp.]
MKKILGILCIGVSLGLSAQNWKVLETPTETTARSENSIVAIGSKIYLFGGRGMKPMEVYDTKTNTWETRGALPLEIHHFQAATYNGEIYVAGALSGPFPHEIPIPNIYIYNPDKDEWRKGDEIPRKRGAAGCFVYRDKIYVVNGIQDGHWDGHVSWFDEYDPKT